jgi:hypothetical protein
MGQTAACVFGKHQNRWLCSAADSPATVRPLQDHLHQGTPRQIFCATARIFRGEHPLKTALEVKNHEKTLTVPEVLFQRKSLSLSMHDFMDSIAIKQYTFCTRPCTAAHFCYTSTHIGWFEEPKVRDWGHHRRTGAVVDLRATLAVSSN